MEPVLEKVKAFAQAAHGDQQRKFAPEPYIAHPLRVMQLCRPYSKGESMLAAALLHDVLEDTETTKEEIQDFLLQIMDQKAAMNTVRIVDELTDIYTKENCPDWNRQKRKDKEADRLSKVSGDAQTVKYADIIDNSKDIINGGKEFAKKYYLECKTLLNVMDKGNEQLRRLAVSEIDQRLRLL